MPSRRIREDHKEYRDIVKGNVSDKLKNHIKSGQRLTRRGKDFVVVKVPHVELPSFRYGQPSDGSGIGNGQADVGDEVGEDHHKDKAKDKVVNLVMVVKEKVMVMRLMLELAWMLILI